MSSHDPSLMIPVAFTALEWRVIALARGEATKPDWRAAPAIGVRAALRRIVTALTGMPYRQPLADGRLEKLRLFVCMIRRRDRRSERVASELIALGYRPELLHRLIAFASA